MPNIVIFTGNILSSPSKTLIISIGENRILKGTTALAIKERFGEELQEELLSREPFEKWECRMIQRDGYNLIFGRPFDYEIRQLTILGVEAVIKNSLKICELNGFSSISISALTANYLPNNEGQINDITHLALSDYFTKNPNSIIKDIYLVNFSKEIFKI